MAIRFCRITRFRFRRDCNLSGSDVNEALRQGVRDAGLFSSALSSSSGEVGRGSGLDIDATKPFGQSFPKGVQEAGTGEVSFGE